MTEAQREAVREAGGARTGAERLRAIAELIEVSPYFDWLASREALHRQRAVAEAQGRWFSEGGYRAFDRPGLAPGTYTDAETWRGHGVFLLDRTGPHGAGRTVRQRPRHRWQQPVLTGDRRGSARPDRAGDVARGAGRVRLERSGLHEPRRIRRRGIRACHGWVGAQPESRAPPRGAPGDEAGAVTGSGTTHATPAEARTVMNTARAPRRRCGWPATRTRW